MPSERRGRRAIARVIFATAVVGGLPGCILLPMPEHGLISGKGGVAEETLAALRSDRATRADVLLRLGEPSERREDDRVFVYGWKVKWGYGFVYFAGGATVPKEKYAAIRFDDEAVVADVFLAEPRWLTSARSALEDWVGSAETRSAPDASPPH